MAADADASTILFWNIRAGGGPARAQSILLEILAHTPDIVALAECRPTFAGQIRAALADHGLRHAVHPSTSSRENGVLLASRHPITAVHAEPQSRLLHATTRDLTITACHIPDASDRAARVTLLSKVHACAAAFRDEKHLILGDFNANRADHPRRDGTAIGKLTTLGYRDLWLHHGGDPHDPTWQGPRGVSARLDHAYASKPLVSQAETAHHHHTPREAGLSDHSLLILRVIHKTP